MAFGHLAGRRRFGRAHTRNIMSDINVTPMVDVMLVLLVISDAGFSNLHDRYSQLGYVVLLVEILAEG